MSAPYPNPPYPAAPYPTSASAPYPSVNASAPLNNGPYQPPMSKLELKVSCRDLVDMDVFSKSDPFVVAYMQGQHKEWNEIGRTEVIMDCLNPDFVKPFIVDYFFEEQQMLKFDVYDSDSDSVDLRKQEYIGRLVTSVGSIVGENGSKIEQHLQTPTVKDTERNDKFTRKSPGKIIVRAEEVNSNKDIVTLEFCGKGLDKKDFFGKSDPYLLFERCNEDNTYSTVHKTEVIKKTLNPTWKSFQVPAQTLCNGDYQRTMKISCFDWDSDGSHDLIGVCETNLQDLVDFRNGRPSFYELINPKKKKSKKKYKHSGTIHIIDCKIDQKATFLDYIRGGLSLNFVVAVDFTASNGYPSDRSSLHYNSEQFPSQYVQVLQAIGGIIEDYDSDKLFPAFGFGAKLPPDFNVYHDFALNFNPSNPVCQGVNGVIAAYYNTVRNVQLNGPTNFAPIINNTARMARDCVQSGGASQYFVLLIITDGIISDMPRTKEAIVEASSLPVSIIIVGVGKAEFEAMEELDGDDVKLSHHDKYAQRDIVQFVPFRDFMQGGVYDPASGVRLAKDVLHELPDQVTEYMEQNNIKPNPQPF